MSFLINKRFWGNVMGRLCFVFPLTVPGLRLQLIYSPWYISSVDLMLLAGA